MSTIELRGVAKAFGATPVLSRVDLVVPDGSTTAVLGASGSGKTTLLRLVAGFEQVDAGTVSIDGAVVDDGARSVRAQHRGVGYVPQEGALFPHMTVMGNVSFGVPRSEHGRAQELIELVGLGDLGRRYPHQLSGGQQQRVALARALIIRPSVVLLDEPFSSLDASLRTGLRRDVARVLAETHATTVLVTHDQNEALALADQIAVLRQGRIVARADPHELYRDPPDITAATSIGEANILSALVQGSRARCVLGTVRLHSNGPVADGPAQLLLRPEQLVLHLVDRAEAVAAVVVDAQFHGHDTLVDIVIDGPARQAVLARVPGDLVLAPGQPVWVEVRGSGRVWSIDSHDTGTNNSLWLRPDPPPDSYTRVPTPVGSGDCRKLEVSGLGGQASEHASNQTPPKRRYIKPIIGLVGFLAVGLVAALLLTGGSSSPSSVGPVVFQGKISFTGELHFTESFTDPATAKGVSSCTSAAKNGDQPSTGPDTWHVPTPPLTTAADFNNDADIVIGTAKGAYHGPGTYSQADLLKGEGSMEITETYLFTAPGSAATMTVHSDGSGNVTFTHVPSDDDRSSPGWTGGISGVISWTCSS